MAQASFPEQWGHLNWHPGRVTSVKLASGSRFIIHGSGSVFRVLLKIRPAASGSGFSVLLKNV